MTLFACGICSIWWIASLCWTMHRPLLYWLVHFESKCSHVSRLLLGHRVQLGFMWVRDQNVFFL